MRGNEQSNQVAGQSNKSFSGTEGERCSGSNDRVLTPVREECGQVHAPGPMRPPTTAETMRHALADALRRADGAEEAAAYEARLAAANRESARQWRDRAAEIRNAMDKLGYE